MGNLIGLRLLFSKYHSTLNLSIALTISAAFWGLFWIPLRQLESSGISASWTVIIFNAFPLIVLVPLFFLFFSKFKQSLKPILYASLAIGMAITFYSKGLVETTVIRATLLFYLTPIWSTIFGIIWLSEKLTFGRVASIIIAIIGLLLLLSGSHSGNKPLNIGDFYGLMSGIFWGLGATFINRWSNMNIIPLTLFCFIFSTIFSLFFPLYFVPEILPDLSLIINSIYTIFIWANLLLLPSFCIIFFTAKFLSPGRVGILMMSEVIVAMFSASILIPDEKMFPIQWLGAFAILLAGFYEVIFNIRKN